MTHFIAQLITALQTDKHYYESWKANIAMAYKDASFLYKRRTKKKFLNAEDTHIIANTAAENFLETFCTPKIHYQDYIHKHVFTERAINILVAYEAANTATITCTVICFLFGVHGLAKYNAWWLNRKYKKFQVFIAQKKEYLQFVGMVPKDGVET